MRRETVLGLASGSFMFVFALAASGTLATGSCPMQKTNTSTCPGTYVECAGQTTQTMCTDQNNVNNQHEIYNGAFSCQASTQQEQCIDDTNTINCTKKGTCAWDGSRSPPCYIGPNYVNTFHVRKIASACPSQGGGGG